MVMIPERRGREWEEGGMEEKERWIQWKAPEGGCEIICLP